MGDQPDDNPNTAPPRFATAISDAADADTALGQALSTLTDQLAGPADLVILFATTHHETSLEAIHHKLNKVFTPRVSLGVTAGGVIGRQREIETNPGLSILAARMPGATLTPFGYEDTDWEAATSSTDALGQAIDTGPDPLKAIVLLADPFSTPMIGLLPAMGERWPGVPVVGGMASGGGKPGLNTLLINGRTRRDGAVGVAIGGNISVDCTISQGCRPIGKPLVITQSQRHVVSELGGRPALKVIQEMIQELDDHDRDLIQTRGLMVGRVINEYKDHFGRGDFLIRHLLGVDQEAGYIAINDPQVRVGQTIQFHVHDRKTAVEDFKLLLESQKLHGQADGALLFSCNGRGVNLFDEPHTDATLVHEALGDVPLAGFFAAGEIGPIGDENFLHGHTASLIVFRNGSGETPAD